MVLVIRESYLLDNRLQSFVTVFNRHFSSRIPVYCFQKSLLNFIRFDSFSVWTSQVFGSSHTFSIRFESGLCAGQSIMFTLVFIGQFFLPVVTQILVQSHAGRRENNPGPALLLTTFGYLLKSSHILPESIIYYQTVLIILQSDLIWLPLFFSKPHCFFYIITF